MSREEFLLVDIDPQTLKVQTFLVHHPQLERQHDYIPRALATAQGVTEDGTRGEFVQVGEKKDGQTRAKSFVPSPGAKRYSGRNIGVGRFGQTITENPNGAGRWIRREEFTNIIK